VSVVDRGEPEASCLEWHGDGTAGEDGLGSHLAAMAPARVMGEARPGRPSLVGKRREGARGRPIALPAARYFTVTVRQSLPSSVPSVPTARNTASKRTPDRNGAPRCTSK
jgi:hypothetical protein